MTISVAEDTVTAKLSTGLDYYSTNVTVHNTVMTVKDVIVQFSKHACNLAPKMKYLLQANQVLQWQIKYP